MMDAIAPPPPRPAPPPVAAGVAPGEALARALAASLNEVERAAADPDAEEMVHDARKAMKEYRALLRLVPGEAAQAARQHTAAAARVLSQSRDRVAAREALQILEGEGLLLACDLTDALAVIGSDAPEGKDAEGHRDTLRAFLAEARARLAGGLSSDAGAADVARGLAKAYAQARRASLGAPETMHEARKRVVTHRYQMSFIAAAFAGRGGKRAARVQKLRDLFGAYQDIETLRPMLDGAEPALPEGTLQRLHIAMAREQKRLKKKAARGHAALFRRGAKSFLRKYRDIF